MRRLVWGLVFAGTVCAVPSHMSAQPPKSMQVSVTKAEPDAVQTATVDEYLAQVAALEAKVEACRASAVACDDTGFARRLMVSSGGKQDVSLRQDWLAHALTKAKTASSAERSELMAQAAERLREEAAEMAAAPAPVADGAAARRDADQILARREFQSVQEETWLTRKWAMLTMAVSAFLTALFANMPSAPWAVPVIWGLVLVAAAVGLLLWAWRVTQQQRVVISGKMALGNAGWQRESEDWARRAEAEAAAGAWREAVHCLYWAAIVLLEGKRLWRANRARTPREYLPLLPAGSSVRTALGGLTRIFERIWYGLRPASQADYEQAQALLETLKAS